MANYYHPPTIKDTPRLLILATLLCSWLPSAHAQEAILQCFGIIRTKYGTKADLLSLIHNSQRQFYALEIAMPE